MIELLQAVPTRVRKTLYFGWIVVAFIYGGVDVAMASAGVSDDPTWFVVVGEVIKYASVPILAVAGANVPAKAEDPIEVTDPRLRRIPPGRGRHRADPDAPLNPPEG